MMKTSKGKVNSFTVVRKMPDDESKILAKDDENEKHRTVRH